MEKDTIVLTRKIQIHIDSDDKEKRASYYQMLFEWQDIVYRAANLVMTHLYIQEQIKDLIYLHDDVKVKLTNRSLDEEGILNTSKMNTTYQILSRYFKGKINTDILSCINMALIKNYNSERIDYWKGTKSLRNYKKDMPIPFSGKSLKLMRDGNNHDFRFSLFKIPFRTYLGKDRSDKKVLLQRVLVGQIKMCASALQIVKGKLFLLLSLEIPKKKYELQEHIIAETSLGIEHPITVQIDKDNYQIGNKEEFLYRRIAIQAARLRNQKAAAFSRGGHGRTKKMKGLEHYRDKEKRYVDYKLHLYSRRLIDICIKAQAGTLLLVNQSQKEEVAKEDVFILRNWSYHGLISKIKYKAELAGIHVIIE